MRKGLVSIIIPVYNTSLFLSKGIESCLNQTYQEVEIIAVNDGSTDFSGEILDNYARMHSKLRVIHTSNQGANAARLEGIGAAYGEWICFMDSDDYMPIDAVGELMKSAIDQNLDMAIGYLTLVQSNRFIVSKNSVKFGKSKGEILASMFVGDISPSLCARIIRRSLFDKIEIPTELIISEDTATNLALFTNADKIDIIDINSYFYVQHKDSTMHKPNSASVISNITFCRWVLNYIDDKPYCDEIVFQNAIAQNFLNKFFAFLRDGGDVNYDRQFSQMIYNVYIMNHCACSQLPIWRLAMIKAYKFSPIFGNIYRFLFSNTRKLFRL